MPASLRPAPDRRLALLLLVLATLVACPGGENDFDGDGVDDDEDCAPEDPAIFPGASDPWGDELDSDCDGFDGVDRDGDGFPSNVDEALGILDCNDGLFFVNPAAPEIQDAIDNDCDGDVDEGTPVADDDGDGYCEHPDACLGAASPGDCDDDDPAAYPADLDGDGVTPCDAVPDCNDTDVDILPGAPERCNGLDDDCSGGPAESEADFDEDGVRGCAGDCDDTDPSLQTLDEDGDGQSTCDPLPDCDDSDPDVVAIDGDGDGWSGCAGDCDDGNPVVYPGASEECDGLDGNCDGVLTSLEFDDDSDGDPNCSDCADDDPERESLDADGDGISSCGGDCDDGDAFSFPNAIDGLGDGVDQNCDGTDGVDADGDGLAALLDCDDSDPDLNEVDADGDGASTCDGDCNDADSALNLSDADFDGASTCGGDCDDSAFAIHPGADEGCDGIDTDCDGAPGASEVDQDGDGDLGCGPDCDDSDPALNTADVDEDGQTTCDAVPDCDDFADEIFAVDSDHDGASVCGGDCDDGDATIFPGAPEICDGADSNCDGTLPDSELDGDGDGDPSCSDCDDADPARTSLDADGDGLPSCSTDCDDNDPFTLPGAADGLGDGVDQNCDGIDGIDLDGDGLPSFLDCDDTDAALNEDDADGDGVSTCDGDCDDNDPAAVSQDADHDGVADCAGDCDEANPDTYPGALEICDGQDNNCDGALPANEIDADGDGDPGCHDCDDNSTAVSNLDADGDGLPSCSGDCDDTDAFTNLQAVDGVGDGVDQNCDGVDGVDIDGDGLASVFDCDDFDAELNDADVDGDGASSCDNDCDDNDPALNLLDGDLDGSSTCGGDCDDSDNTVHPDAVEACNLQDDDCDGALGATEVDADGDGGLACDVDCDDSDPSLNVLDADGDGQTTCDPVPDCDDSDPAILAIDFDADGVSVCGGDCDDRAAEVFPGAAEVCDGADSDCDGQVPPGEVDQDGDGDPACRDCDDGDATVETLDVDNDFFSTCAGDCDDGAAFTFPDAPDGLGDAIDENCDGIDGVDADGDGLPSVLDCDDGDPDMNEEDGDGDGSSSCDGDCDDDDASLNLLDGDFDGSSTCDGDCDDGFGPVRPGAPEICDGIDDDCDGVLGTTEVDEDGDGELACGDDCDDDDPALNSLDLDGDGQTSCAALADCDDDDPLVVAHDDDGDGVSDCGGDCDDGDADVFPGGDELCDGLDSDCDGAIPSGEADGDGDGDPACSDCDDGDPDRDSLDADGDGLPSCAADCDDAAPFTLPGSVDGLGDGVDQNCDGVDGIDADGDGLAAGLDCDDSDPAANDDDLDGDGGSTCDGDCDDADPLANVDDADFDSFDTCTGDCDDAAFGINPGATEVCDFLDNDCNGIQTDEGDADGDGDPACSDCDDDNASLDSLDGDADGDTSCGGDCDDTDADFGPGAADLLGDGVDQDCDGADGVERDGDGFASVASGGTDCNDSNPAVNPGQVEVFGDGIDNDCDGVDGLDADGDGYASVATAGADCADDDNSVYPGQWEHPADGFDQNCDGLDGNAAFEFLGGELDGTARQTSAQAVCDLNGDGIPDLAIGSPGWGTMSEGRVFIYYGPIRNGGPLGFADATLTGSVDIINGDEPVGENLGYSLVCLGDQDGDGEDDLAVAAPGGAPTGLGDVPGKVYLVMGAPTGDTVLGSAGGPVITMGFSTGDQQGQLSLGGHIAAGQDLTGDGISDLAIAYGEVRGVADEFDAFNAAYGIFLVAGPLVTDDDLTSPAAFIALSEEDIEGPGIAASWGNIQPFAMTEDANGDGTADLVIAMSSSDTAGGGWLLSGPLAGAIDRTVAATVLVDDFAGNSLLADSVAALGDLVGDGLADLALTDASSVWVFAGATASGGLLQTTAQAAWSFAAPACTVNCAILDTPAVAAAGDLDGDGARDLLITGTYQEDGNTIPSVRAWAVFGPLSGSDSPESGNVEELARLSETEVGELVPVGAADFDRDGWLDPVLGKLLVSQGQASASILVRGVER